MATGKKRFLFIPLVGVVVLALAVFLLGRAGVIDVPWGPGSEALASDGSEDGDGKEKDGDEDEEEVIPVPVELAKAERRAISAFYRASSFVEADRHVELVAKTTGRVRKVNFEEGDWVRAGDVLAELENERERVSLRREKLKVEDQQRQLERNETLLAQSLITQEEFDDARSAFDLAEAERDLSAIALEETIIRAPFDGQVTDRKIVPGQHVNQSEALFTLVDMEQLRVRIHLPEVVARKVSAGDQVQILVEAVPDPVLALVERVAPIVDPTTSTVRLTLRLRDEDADLRVGGFVKVRIVTDTQMEALAVPKLALVEEGGLRSVFLAESDSVRKVEVRTGLYDDSHIEILDGLEEGAHVVSLGQGGLRSGSKIEVLNATEVGWVAPEKDEGEDEEEDDDETGAVDGDDTTVALGDEASS